MALPEKAIEQLSREPVKTPGWSFQILMVSGTIFFITLAIYFGMLVGYKPFFTRQLNDVERQIEEFTKKIPEKSREDIIIFYSQLSNLSTLLKKQPKITRLLPWVESHTHPRVVLTGLSADTTKQQLKLKGTALSVEDLVEQLKVFEALEMSRGGRDIVRISFDGTSLQEEKQKKSAAAATGTEPLSIVWPFDIEITLSPSFFTATSTIAK